MRIDQPLLSRSLRSTGLVARRPTTASFERLLETASGRSSPAGQLSESDTSRTPSAGSARQQVTLIVPTVNPAAVTGPTGSGRGGTIVVDPTPLPPSTSPGTPTLTSPPASHPDQPTAAIPALQFPNTFQDGMKLKVQAVLQQQAWADGFNLRTKWEYQNQLWSYEQNVGKGIKTDPPLEPIYQTTDAKQIAQELDRLDPQPLGNFSYAQVLQQYGGDTGYKAQTVGTGKSAEYNIMMARLYTPGAPSGTANSSLAVLPS